MKKRIFLSLSISATILLIYCNGSFNKSDFSKLLNSINSNNENFRVPDVDVKDYINEVPYDSLFNSEDIEKMIESEDENKSIVSKEEAIEDINFLFNILKNNYSLYTYLGGDLEFLSAKENIINGIDTDTISSKDLCNIITKKLNFINDNHFVMSYKSQPENKLGETSYFYILDKEYYYKDDIGFFIKDEKKKKYIVSINNDIEVEAYMNLSISDNGEVVYKISKLLTPDNDNENIREGSYLDADISYKAENEIITEKRTLIRANHLSNTGNTFYIEVKNNIPILSLRSFSLDEKTKDEFLQSAFELKNYNINILDLRGNSGGDGDLVVKWLENRFGFRPVGNSKKIGINRFLINGKLPSEEEFGKLKDLFNLEFKDDYYYSKDIDNENLYDNDSLIFVLTDVNEASSAEVFIEYIKNYENVILVGTNTSGSMQGSSYGMDFRVPNSEIYFKFGQWIYLYDKEYFRESVGYKPDIWVNGNDALDKTLDLIKYYNLK